MQKERKMEYGKDIMKVEKLIVKTNIKMEIKSEFKKYIMKMVYQDMKVNIQIRKCMVKEKCMMNMVD